MWMKLPSIKTLTAMPRRTPLLAIILAPVALYLLAQLWGHALVPLYRAVWYGDTVMKWRLTSDQPAIRIQAAKDAGLWRAVDAPLLDELLVILETDESAEVRKTTAATLGLLGSRRPLSAEAVNALGALVLTESDNVMLSAAIVAVGQSAAWNRYPDSVIERIAEISGEKHLEWIYSRAATALGQIGAAQPLPDTVFAVMNSRFTDPQYPGERQDLANAFAEIAKGSSLPIATLDILAAEFVDEPNHHVRQAILYALAYAPDDYPPSIAVITAATNDPDPSVVSAAENGLRVIEYNRTLANKDPLSAAMNTAEPVETRLNALRIIRSTPIDPAAWEQIAALSQDSETGVAVAAIDLFHYLARSADADFDQRVLIPALGRALSDPDPPIRYAAYAALSTISRNRPAYLRAADFPAQLEAGANDPDPKVRVVAMVMLLRDDEQRAAIIERGMTDPDPYVRINAVGWLGLPETMASQRETFIAKALDDPDPNVRRSATTTQQNRDTRERAWPIELWRLWQAGEHGKVGMSVLIAVTVATPVLICGIFLIYFMARLLTYLQVRRWRAIALVPVMATWATASYGMFLLYFAAGHANNPDAGETAILAGVLWGAIVAYTALGWGMHYAVRR
jgi:HEAT repeat protein